VALSPTLVGRGDAKIEPRAGVKVNRLVSIAVANEFVEAPCRPMGNFLAEPGHVSGFEIRRKDGDETEPSCELGLISEVEGMGFRGRGRADAAATIAWLWLWICRLRLSNAGALLTYPQPLQQTVYIWK
jgi:hypothetical protein